MNGMNYSGVYSQDITGQSLKELVEFIKWYNKHIGHEPLIIGGWAAWAYHQGMGSKDVDVIFPGNTSMHRTLEQYFSASGYKMRKTSFVSYEFYKTRRAADGREVEVIIDAMASDRFAVINGTKLTIPWAMAEKHKRRHEFGKGADAWIATPEMLITYKVGALLGRDYNLFTSQPENREHIESKLWKDAQDVLGVLEKTEVDRKKLSELLSQNKLGKKWVAKAREIAERYLDGRQMEAFREKWAEFIEAKKR